MENTQNYLLILEESLNKKIVFLDELSKLTNFQKDIVSAEEFDEEAFSKNLEQKDAIIRELDKFDRGFQILYDNIKAQIETNRDMYASEIKRLQELIKEVLDKSTNLQVMESRNKDLVKSRFASLKKEVRQLKKSRELAASYYKTMNNISSEPFFLDKKK